MCFVCMIMHFSAFPGKETQEYRAILRNMSTLTETLLEIPGATDSLTLRFKERNWLAITAKPSEEDLIILVLSRIKADTSSFYEFLTMLHSIAGMDQVVALLEEGGD